MPRVSAAAASEHIALSVARGEHLVAGVAEAPVMPVATSQTVIVEDERRAFADVS
jgi:hypothetical protein